MQSQVWDRDGQTTPSRAPREDIICGLLQMGKVEPREGRGEERGVIYIQSNAGRWCLLLSASL